MSFGSRATQEKPEALVILFRANFRNPIRRVAAELCAFVPDFYAEVEWPHVQALRAVVQCGTANDLRRRVVRSLWMTNSNTITITTLTVC